MGIPAIVLAGGKTKGELREISGVEDTALIEICGRPMVSYVLQALSAAESVGEIIVVGPEAVKAIAHAAGAGFHPAGETLPDNVLGGIGALTMPADNATNGGSVLLVTCDVPLLTPEAVDSFTRASLDSQADFCYPIVPRETYEAHYPAAHRTWVKLKDGRFTGGNLALGSRRFLQDNQAAIREFFAARKSPAKLALLVGPGFLIRLVLGMASIASAERRAEAMFGCKARAVICSHPEVGMDVDKAADLEFVRRWLDTGAGRDA